MASSRSKTQFLILRGLVCAGLGLSGSMAYAADPPATAAPTPVFDARRSLPMFPASSWKDGFFVEHSQIGDFGLHVRLNGIYGHNPLGNGDDGSGVPVDNRFTLHTSALLSIANLVELGLALPIVLYQDSSGFNLTTTAIGDLRLLGKINFRLPDKLPQIALSVGLGFETATKQSGFGAGGISGYPRLIIDMPKLFAKRIHIAINGGAVIAGTTRPCTAVELEQQANMPSMTNTMPGTGMMMDVPAPACEKRSLGLGNHFLYGAGVSANVSADQGIYLTTELLGSVSIGLEETRTPLFWDIGIRRAKANSTFFTAAYGIGLNSSSPSHTFMVSLGLIWENKPPEKKKEPEKTKLEINLTVNGQITAVAAPTVGKDGSVKVEAKPVDASKPPEAPKSPEAPKPQVITTEVDIPDGLVPKAEAKGEGKSEKKGK
jgi:hypothetical protein